MWRGISPLGFGVTIALSSLIVLIFFAANVSLLSSSKLITPNEALFIEGVISVLVGFLLLLGRGGLNPSNQAGAVLAAAAEAVCGAENVGPAESMRRDAWKSKGFIRAGLVLFVAGLLMLIAYGVSL